MMDTIALALAAYNGYRDRSAGAENEADCEPLCTQEIQHLEGDCDNQLTKIRAVKIEY